MVHGKNRIPYWIDRRLNGLAGPEYHAIISFGLPIEPEDSQYGKSWVIRLPPTVPPHGLQSVSGHPTLKLSAGERYSPPSVTGVGQAYLCAIMKGELLGVLRPRPTHNLNGRSGHNSGTVIWIGVDHAHEKH